MFQKLGKNFFFVLGDFFMGGNGFENLKIPIIGSKIKVVTDLLSDLSKQAQERH